MLDNHIIQMFIILNPFNLWLLLSPPQVGGMPSSASISAAVLVLQADTCARKVENWSIYACPGRLIDKKDCFVNSQ